MQILKTVESRVSRLGGEKSEKKETSERKFKEFECCVLSSELKPLQYFCDAISREKNLQYFSIFRMLLELFIQGLFNTSPINKVKIFLKILTKQRIQLATIYLDIVGKQTVTLYC